MVERGIKVAAKRTLSKAIGVVDGGVCQPPFVLIIIALCRDWKALTIVGTTMSWLMQGMEEDKTD